MNKYNEIPWSRAQQLGSKEQERPLSKKEYAIAKQTFLDNMAVSFIPSIINSRKDLSEQGVIDFAYGIVNILSEKAVRIRQEIDAITD